MPQHLQLPQPQQVPSRRTSQAGGKRPTRQPGVHGGHLKQQLTRVVQKPRRLDEGVDPRLVFKISAQSRPTEETFLNRGLKVLGETVDYTYFVLAEDQGSSLATDLEKYTKTGNLKSFFDLIEGIEPYGPEDRMGPGLDEAGLEYTGQRTFDVAIWPSGRMLEAQARATTVETVVEQSTNDSVLLSSITPRRSYLRVSVSSKTLNDLLDVSVIETIRTPPVPYLDFRDWWSADTQSLQRETKSGGVVGILDDSPHLEHPLLKELVLSDEHLAPDSYGWQRRGTHGTEVTGRVLYPNLHDELRARETLTAVGSVRSVRVLEPAPGLPGTSRFATFGFPHQLVEDGIRHLHSKYGVHVFNLSLGYAEPFNDLHVGALTEVIDDLVRELDIVVVVPTGNAPITFHAETLSGHHVIDDKPHYFFSKEHRLSEPAPAALAVTVGSIALSGASAERSNQYGWRAVAEPDEASPFSRSGPGLGTNKKRLNKPEVVDYGGNAVVNDSGHIVQNEPGASIVTPSFKADGQRLLSAVNGTSFAAPAVARVAADIADAYPNASANLIRSLLGLSARLPKSATSAGENHLNSWVYGYGRPDREAALSSNSNRVTLTYDGDMPIDTVQIHPLPVPEIFRRGTKAGERSITVSLSFDPPVRRQRREYLAGTMQVDVFRDIDADSLREMLAKQDPDDPQPLITGRQRLKLTPGSDSFLSSTLQVRSWSRRKTFVDDSDTFYVVVTHKAQTWARDDPEYMRQRYALCVCLEDQHLVEADLYQTVSQQLQIPIRARVVG